MPHKRLLSKLHSYEMNDNIINSVTNFLTGSKYRVRVNGSYSSWAEVTCGIQQGSVLGPLLFLIYINDLIDCCEKFSDFYLFADDAKLFHHLLQPGDQQILQNRVNELVEWTWRWLLTVNIKKCLVVSFGRDVNKNFTYTIPQNNQQQIVQLKEALLSGI